MACGARHKAKQSSVASITRCFQVTYNCVLLLQS